MYKHPTGLWYWRRTDPKTGRRLHRSTGTRRKDLAQRKAAQFDDEWEKAAAGIPSLDWARVELRSLIDDWLAGQRDREVSERTRNQRKAQLLRTLDALRLTVIADLCDVGALDRRLRAVKEPQVKLQRGYQTPLKLFAAWLAENNRSTDRNLLATWKKLQVPKGEAPRRAVLPDEVARALAVAEGLDVYHRRQHPTRPVLLALLVTAPRAAAFCARDVEHLLAGRIDYGPGTGNKRNGWGALDLDAGTVDELRE